MRQTLTLQGNLQSVDIKQQQKPRSKQRQNEQV
jgi:hypothetical protein